MARIRSVLPGLFTDEAFVAMSEAAQVLYIGLWTECDDQGVFEWKPITIRMRLRPTKDGPVEPLLSEMEAVNCIRQFEVDGRQYGAVRNFRRYQKPKSPNSVYPCPPDIGNYTGLARPISEIETDEVEPIPPNGEKSSLMERRGEEGGEEGGKTDSKIDIGKPRSRNGAAYAFEARTIRLTAPDFKRWQENFPHLSLRGELEQLDEWAGQQGKNWFQAVAGALAKRERAATERAASQRDGPAAGYVKVGL